MKNIISSITKLSLATLVVGVLASFLTTPPVSAAYVGGRLIDDPVFLNATSMSPAQIQSFLASKGSYLTNYTATETLDSYPNYGKNVSAAQIIYDAGQVYGFNPQAILATLQKEEGLVTDPSPDSGQINFAMGYACYDSTGCSKYSGFFNQVDNGTWQLRFNYERARGNNTWWNSSLSYPCGGSTQYYSPGLYSGNNVSFIDDYGTVYTNFVLENASTAALYCYTPHAYPGSTRQYYSGSYNFVLVFEQWFGPTQSSLLLKGSGSTVYLVYAGTRYGVPSGAVLDAYGLGGSRISATSDSYLNSLTNGGILTNLFVIQGDQTVYLADSGKRHGIPSGTYCTHWSLDCSHNIAAFPTSLGSLFPPAEIVQSIMVNKGTYYLMDNGVRKPFLSPNAVTERGYSMSSFTPINNLINSSQPVGGSLSQNTSLVKFGNSSAIYYYNAGNYTVIPSFDAYKSWFTASDYVFLDAISSYNSSPPASTGTFQPVVSYAGKTYVVDQYHKYDISSVANQWSSPQDATSKSALLGRIPTTVVNSQNVWQSPTGSIFAVESNAKRTIYTWDDFVDLGHKTSEVIGLSNWVTSGLTQGPGLLASAATFKYGNSPAIYVVGNGSQVYALSSMSDFSGYRLDPSKVRQLDAQTYSYYTQSAPLPLSYLVKDGGASTNVVSSSGEKVLMNTQALSNWGFNANQFALMSTNLLSRLPASNISPTFFASNGVIYYGATGQKHPIGSFETYKNMGGNSANTVSVGSEVINSVPTGSGY